MNSDDQLVPQQVRGITNVVAISVGLTGRHTLVLLKDEALRGWGNTDWGQLGGGVFGTFQERPFSPKLAGVKAVFAAGNNSFAVRTDNPKSGSLEPSNWEEADLAGGCRLVELAEYPAQQQAPALGLS